MDVVDRSRVDRAHLHLKIKAYHADIASGNRQKTLLKQQDIAEAAERLLMPWDWLLKDIDPEGKRQFSEVKALVVKRAHSIKTSWFNGRRRGPSTCTSHSSTTYGDRAHGEIFRGDAYAWGAANGRCVRTQLC